MSKKKCHHLILIHYDNLFNILILYLKFLTFKIIKKYYEIGNGNHLANSTIETYLKISSERIKIETLHKVVVSFFIANLIKK